MSFNIPSPFIKGAWQDGQSGIWRMTPPLQSGQTVGGHMQSLRLMGPSGLLCQLHTEHRVGRAQRSGRRAAWSSPPIHQQMNQVKLPNIPPTSPTMPPIKAAPPRSPPGSSPDQPAKAPPSKPNKPKVATQAQGRSRRRSRNSSTAGRPFWFWPPAVGSLFSHGTSF